MTSAYAIADAKAWSQVRQPEAFVGLPLRHAQDRQLLIWQRDLSSLQSWALYQEPQHQRFVVRRILFDRIANVRQVWPENPHLYGSEGMMEPEAGKQLLAPLERLVAASFLSRQGIVLDGTWRGLEFGADAQRHAFEWMDAPGDSAELQEQFVRLQECFDALLPRHSGLT